jgi:hypothetical protein
MAGVTSSDGYSVEFVGPRALEYREGQEVFFFFNTSGWVRPGATVTLAPGPDWWDPERFRRWVAEKNVNMGYWPVQNRGASEARREEILRRVRDAVWCMGMVTAFRDPFDPKPLAVRAVSPGVGTADE